jgi:hypothetical protein
VGMARVDVVDSRVFLGMRSPSRDRVCLRRKDTFEKFGGRDRVREQFSVDGCDESRPGMGGFWRSFTGHGVCLPSSP